MVKTTFSVYLTQNEKFQFKMQALKHKKNLEEYAEEIINYILQREIEKEDPKILQQIHISEKLAERFKQRCLAKGRKMGDVFRRELKARSEGLEIELF